MTIVTRDEFDHHLSLAEELSRRRLGILDDQQLAEKMRDVHAYCERWRRDANLLRPYALQDPEVAEKVRRIDDAIAIVGGVIVDIYAREVARRLARRQQPTQRRVTLADLERDFPDRLLPGGPNRRKAFCPWHRDTGKPNLVLYEEGWAHCFACQQHRSFADLYAVWRQEGR